MGKLLKQAMTMKNLANAWEAVADNKGAPGVDGVTIERFARRWQENLVKLRAAVLANTYRPRPLKRFTIPKADGSPRLMGNPTVADKVVQRAVLNILDDIYEPQFLDCSFAYRPGRSVPLAVERLVQARQFGRRWVLDADIDDFFHSLDHHLLLRFLRETITDEGLLALIVAWLTIGRPDPAWAAGTPLGAVISPLLSNIYLHYLDLAMAGPPLPWPLGRGERRPNWVYLRYADDFVVLCRSRAEAETAWRWVEETLDALLLQLEPAKTQITNFDEGFTYLGCRFQGNAFWFEHEGQPVKVDNDGDWGLFHRHGPDGYQSR